VAKTKQVTPPWLTDQGIDMTKVPLEHNFKTAVGSDPKQARNSNLVLGCASSYRRLEAAVFLMGLLAFLREDDLETRIVVVENLGTTHSECCARVLFSELRRVKSSNATRRYVNAIIRVLERFPTALVQSEFEALA
jgi:hypothetical protein